MSKIDIEERIAEAHEHAKLTKEQIVDVIKENRDEINQELYLDRKDKGILDSIQEKMVSRKLLVFGTATALMWWGLDSETWGMIAMMYIGGQSAIDMVNVWKWGK